MKTGQLTRLGLLLAAMALSAAGLCAADVSPSVVVHFGKGEASLSTEDKSKIRELFSHYAVDAQARVFVLGYTDSNGDPQQNYKLSRQRAQAVRREIVSGFGVDATIVVALGIGEGNPVADNRLPDGQARNRRAEIYLANARVRNPERRYGSQDPYLPDIQRLVKEADALIRLGQLDQAIAALRKAHAIGGDHYSDWHAAFGIAGFYAHAPLETVRAHLDQAIQLDPHNFSAREFLSRTDARHRVASGEVSKEMGQRMETPIVVSALAQEHEFLRLFGVEPLSRHTDDQQAIDVWECLDSAGRPVAYYFDYSGIHDWGFERQARKAAAMDRQVTGISNATVVAADVRGSNRPAELPDRAGNTDTIWESTVFK
jgi:tetratricopeptide (TPR) repeat protein